MNRKSVLSLVLLFFGLVILVSQLYFINKPDSKSRSSKQQVLPAFIDSNNKTLQISHGGETYSLDWTYVKNIEKLSYIPNYIDKLTSKEVMEKYNCNNLFSGGFYDKSGEPIGLVVVNKGKLSDYQETILLNGFLSINTFYIPLIEKRLPNENVIYSVQSGPLLIRNGEHANLSGYSKKQARRLVAATTGNNQLMFLIVYKENSKYIGPELEDLPAILSKFESTTSIDLADSINLDGGHASVFITKDKKLVESTNAGGFFCVN